MASKAVKPIPDGYHTVTPFINVKGVAKLIDFLKSALGAEEVIRMPGPDGTVMHAEVSIGNSRLMLGEPMQTGASTSAFYVYVSDVDSMYKRATGAGAKSVSPPTDQFWGDRMATVQIRLETPGRSPRTKRIRLPTRWPKRMAAQNR